MVAIKYTICTCIIPVTGVIDFWITPVVSIGTVPKQSAWRRHVQRTEKISENLLLHKLMSDPKFFRSLIKRWRLICTIVILLMGMRMYEVVLALEMILMSVEIFKRDCLAWL